MVVKAFHISFIFTKALNYTHKMSCLYLLTLIAFLCLSYFHALKYCVLQIQILLTVFFFPCVFIVHKGDVTWGCKMLCFHPLAQTSR